MIRVFLSLISVMISLTPFFSYSFPLKSRWNFINNNNKLVQIDCYNERFIHNFQKSFSANKKESILWELYHNDGEWEQQGKWSCEVITDPQSKKPIKVKMEDFYVSGFEELTFTFENNDVQLKVN